MERQLRIDYTTIEGPHTEIAPIDYHLDSDVVHGHAAYRIKATFRAVSKSSQQYILLNCFSGENPTPAHHVFRKTQTEARIKGVNKDGNELELEIPGKHASEWQLSGANDCVAIYPDGNTTVLPEYVSKWDPQPKLIGASTLQFPSALSTELQQKLRLSKNAVAMVHYSSGSYVYPFSCSLKEGESATVDVCVSSTGWPCESGYNNRNFFRPGTTRFRVGFLMNYHDTEGARTILSEFSVRKVAVR